MGRFTAEDPVLAQNRMLPNGIEVADPLSLNLYTYCGNNPIMYVDSSGRVWWFAIGALVGAIIGASADVVAQLQEGKGWDDLDLGSIGISAGAGAISGAIGTTGLGILGQIVCNSLISGAESILRDVIYGKDVDLGKAAINLGIGGLAGFFVGPGLQTTKNISYGRLISSGGEKFGVYTFQFTSTRMAQTIYKEFLKGATKGFLVEFIIDGDTITAIFEEKSNLNSGVGIGAELLMDR